MQTSRSATPVSFGGTAGVPEGLWPEIKLEREAGAMFVKGLV